MALLIVVDVSTLDAGDRARLPHWRHGHLLLLVALWPIYEVWWNQGQVLQTSPPIVATNQPQRVRTRCTARGMTLRSDEPEDVTRAAPASGETEFSFDVQTFPPRTVRALLLCCEMHPPRECQSRSDAIYVRYEGRRGDSRALVTRGSRRRRHVEGSCRYKWDFKEFYARVIESNTVR